MLFQNINALRILLEQGLIESLAQALIGAVHKSNSMSLHRDIHVLLVAIVTKLLELPGSHQMQAVLDLHVILDYVELSEKLHCRASSTCSAIRDAQVALFDGELDALTTKMSNPSGFRLRSTASYLASASYFTSGNCGKVLDNCIFNIFHPKLYKIVFQFLRRLVIRVIMGLVHRVIQAYIRLHLQYRANLAKES